jgi:hypothetical protein
MNPIEITDQGKTKDNSMVIAPPRRLYNKGSQKSVMRNKMMQDLGLIAAGKRGTRSVNI